MGALGHYLEAAGIPTTQISLVREHTEALSPPRALWVPFILGRPFGVPHNAAFQRKVLLAALQLLERGHGPVIEDFPIDAPSDPESALPEGLACPVSFPSAQGEGALVDRFRNEVSQLQAWHDVAMKARGKSSVGVAATPVAQIVEYFATWLSGSEPRPVRENVSRGDALRFACMDLKAYYYEAKSVQPGNHTSESMEHWFWNDTVAAMVFLNVRETGAAIGDASTKAAAANNIVPRSVDRLMGRSNGH